MQAGGMQARGMQGGAAWQGPVGSGSAVLPRRHLLTSWLCLVCLGRSTLECTPSKASSTHPTQNQPSLQVYKKGKKKHKPRRRVQVGWMHHRRAGKAPGRLVARRMDG